MSDATRPQKKTRFSQNLVTIKAGTGDDRQDFHVHEDIIKDKSKYFRAAFDKRWAEGQSRTIELPEDDSSTVEEYIQWLYSARIPTPDMHSLPTGKDRHEAYQHLLRLYVFGEKIQDDTFCDDAICVVLQACDQKAPDNGLRFVPNCKNVSILYDRTREGAKARDLMVWLHVKFGNGKWIHEENSKNHPEFLADLAVAIMRERRRQLGLSTFKGRERWLKKT